MTSGVRAGEETGVSVMAEIETDRTIVRIRGTREVAVVVTSAAGERIYLPPAVSDGDERAGATEDDGSPYEGIPTESPYEGIPAETPYEGIPTESPYEGIPAETPYEGIPTESPYEGMQTESPYEGMQTESPYTGMQTEGSAESQTESPYDGIRTESPYEGLLTDSPYEGGSDDDAGAEHRTVTASGVVPTEDGIRIVHPEPATDVRFLR